MITPAFSEDIEGLSRTIHGIYQAEAERQKDVRHTSSYEDLPENVKEYDRVLARFMRAHAAEVREEERARIRKAVREFQAEVRSRSWFRGMERVPGYSDPKFQNIIRDSFHLALSGIQDLITPPPPTA